MEAEIQIFGDVGIGALLVWKLDAEADGRAACVESAAVRCIHDPGATARTDDEALRVQTERQGPTGDAAREFTRFFVITRHFQVGFGVANPFCPLGVAAAARARSNFF